MIWRFVLRIERSLFCVPVHDTLFISQCISAQEYKWAPKNCLEDLKKFFTKEGGGGEREREERAGGVNL